MQPVAEASTNLQAFYERIAPLHLAPLWEVYHELITPEPRSPCVPCHWSYAAVRGHLLDAGQLISAKEAERRVLILENPALAGQASVTHSLFAGLQLVLPGETAPCHRHAQSALRLIVEGRGAFTAINGERAYMERGDFIITGAGSWHDHGNSGSEPVVWLDGLDIPLVRLLDASYVERYEAETYPESRPAGDTLARFGAGLVPVGFRGEAPHSPLFHYPYARSREALEKLARQGPLDPHHGLKMAFVNPADGGPPLPTISTFVQLLPQSFATAPCRSTDGTVYSVIKGEGESQVGEQSFVWQPGDVFVAPSWQPVVHRARSEAVLFSFSDRIVQEKLGLWREWRG
ncbi:MAG TPA: gentisate 1,2-dioxygenase [bacterium]|nr:gentisate 1,2-dioxygenase [bacterium]